MSQDRNAVYMKRTVDDLPEIENLKSGIRINAENPYGEFILRGCHGFELLQYLTIRGRDIYYISGDPVKWAQTIGNGLSPIIRMMRYMCRGFFLFVTYSIVRSITFERAGLYLNAGIGDRTVSSS